MRQTIADALGMGTGRLLAVMSELARQPSPVAGAAAAEERLELAQFNAPLNRQWGALPEPQRTIVRHWSEGMRHQQIASLMRLDAGYVAQQLAAALAQLRVNANID